MFFSCAVCTNINEFGSKRLLLKGLCSSAMEESIFDTEYYVNGLVNQRLYFKYEIHSKRSRVKSGEKFGNIFS
jgi:hypothetical protein